MSDQADFISGRTHPELFLPSELFDHLIETAYADDIAIRADFREAMPQRAGNAMPAGLWNRLEQISLTYLSDVKQLRDLHRTTVTQSDVKARIAQQTAGLQALMCRDRAAAIRAARDAFGEQFDRFVYKAVAPGMFIAVGRGGVIPAEREREIEGGCR